MKAIVTIQHPAHVHFFRHAIRELRDRGHEVHVLAREKEHVVELLEAFDIDFELVVREPTSRLSLLGMQLAYEYRLFRYARRIEPDVLTAIAEPGIAHVSRLTDARSLLFIDTENARVQNALAVPFAHRICTPASFTGELGRRHVRYDGFHELAYLHPNRFEPRPELLRAHGVEPMDPYFVLRLVAWNAVHDWGKEGLSPSGVEAIVSTLEEHGDVYISAEGGLPASLSSRRLPVPAHAIHDLLYFADGYLGDSGTMATEAAVLGTPAICVAPFVANGELGNFVELESEYGLLFSTPDERLALDRVSSWFENGDHREAQRRRRERLLSEKIDVTSFIIDQLQEMADSARPRVPA